MISQLIPVKKENKEGVVVAVVLFVLQMVYYQMQDYVFQEITFLLPQQGETGIAFLGINRLASLIFLLHIIVHAAFSVVIIWFLYKDRQGTMVVVYLSIALILAYFLTNLAGKFTDLFTINIISTQILAFISSPFKTIFSIPMLKIKHGED